MPAQQPHHPEKRLDAESGLEETGKEKSGTTPLVDTGQLYNDFDWEITGNSLQNKMS